MRFMKCETFFWEVFFTMTFINVVILLIMIILCLPDPSVIIVISIGIVFILMQVLFCISEKKHIIMIDENGISYWYKDKILWSFAWEEIAELYVGRSNSRHRAIYIFPKNPPKIDLHTPSNDPNYTFELCRKAKIALKQYCRCLIVKKTTHSTSEWYRF